jgi:hypothetical protein
MGQRSVVSFVSGRYNYKLFCHVGCNSMFAESFGGFKEYVTIFMVGE